MVLALLVIFIGLRGIHALRPEPTTAAITTDQLVVVGVEGRSRLTTTDRTVLAAAGDRAQAGAIAIRPRKVGDCATAGWATLGSGRRTAVGGRCRVSVTALGAVRDWRKWQAAAAADRGDARLGTLADASTECVASVGPGAALAAAHSDGTSDGHLPVGAYISGGYRSPCALTLVDAGDRSDEIIAALAKKAVLAKQQDLTLIVTGIGPASGSEDPALQVIYRIGSSPPGWLTSDSTRRTGIVTLGDLTRTLIQFTQRKTAQLAPLPVDGAPMIVLPGTITPDTVQHRLDSVAALSDSLPIIFIGIAIVGPLLVAGLIIGLWRRRYTVPRLVTSLSTVWLMSMIATGILPWWRTSSPTLVLGILFAVIAVVLTWLTMVISRRIGHPIAVVSAAITMALLTADAALGAPMQTGSLLNSRPIFALRWYGFGNVTFAAYAGAALLLAGYLADQLIDPHRLRSKGRRCAVLTVLAVGGVAVICEGWPSMGSDFGGVIGLMPGLLWLAFALSGSRVSGWRIVAMVAVTIGAVAAISWLDWLRPANQRSHLGAFVQRVIDGDALSVVSRKAVASIETIVSPVGIAAVIIGVVLWIVIFRYPLPVLAEDFPTLRHISVAVLLTAVLGTVLNDGGVYIWLTMTAWFAMSVLSLLLDRAPQQDPFPWARRRAGVHDR